MVVVVAAAAAVTWGCRAKARRWFFYIFFENLRRVSVTTHGKYATWYAVLRWPLFFRELGKTHGKRFAEYAIKDTWQRSYLPADLCRELFAVCYTSGPLPWALAHGKQPVSGSEFSPVAS